MTGPPLYLTDTTMALGRSHEVQIAKSKYLIKRPQRTCRTLDSNHLAYVSQTLSETEASSGYSIWRLLKHKYNSDDYISKDLALEKFLELQ
ncbi:hypothetical protein H4Q26_003344 [Puccinia striiformis f. sp. tritici PST-130]|nr:hypothetical protein H4Q26_003344 [Puccinia striiformis f. sp. tritici PST-130]